MTSIAIFSLPNLTLEQQDEILALSKVGKAVWMESGKTDKYNRLRYVDLTVLQELATIHYSTVWTFPDRLEDEDDATYIGRVRVAGVQAFNDLKNGLIFAIWLSEAGYTLLSEQPEFKAL